MRSLHTTTKSSPRLPQLEKTREQQQRPNTAKKKTKKQKTDPSKRRKLQIGQFLENFISEFYQIFMEHVTLILFNGSRVLKGKFPKSFHQFNVILTWFDP